MTIKEIENKNDVSKIETIFHEHVAPLVASLANGCMIDKIAEKENFPLQKNYHLTMNPCSNCSRGYQPLGDKLIKTTTPTRTVKPCLLII